MSLTSYRAAPPRANSMRGPYNQGAGTYSRFEGDVKGFTASGRRLPLIWVFAGFLSGYL